MIPGDTRQGLLLTEWSIWVLSQLETLFTFDVSIESCWGIGTSVCIAVSICCDHWEQIPHTQISLRTVWLSDLSCTNHPVH